MASVSPWITKADGNQESKIDEGEARQALSLLFDPDEWYRLQALPGSRSMVINGSDIDGAMRIVRDFASADNIHYGLNPVLSSLGSDPVLVPDVIRRRKFIIDVDPRRAPGVKQGATDVEKEAAVAVVDAVAADLKRRGWPDPLRIDSGNGGHLVYRIDLPNDDPSRQIIAQALAALGQIHDSPIANIDPNTAAANRTAKLPGCWAKKGKDTKDRPYRPCKIISIPTAWTEVPRELIEELASQKKEKPRKPPEPSAAKPKGKTTKVGADLEKRVVAYIGTIEGAVQGDNGSGKAYGAACRVGPGFDLQPDVAFRLLKQHYNPKCVPPWSDAELWHKIDDAYENEPRRGFLLEEEPARNGRVNGEHHKPEPTEEPEPINKEDLATAADLVREQAGIVWVWEGWIQKGVLCLLASEPGIGKTRFCLDLCRRIYLGLEWPDGSPPTFPAGSSSLWVAADNQHSELAEIPNTFGFPPEALYLNTTKGDLYGGTELSNSEQLGRFEFNLRVANPAIAIIDTITNSGDFKSQDTSDAKKQYKPLQEIAKRTGIPIICVTHLNAGGKTLGRRADEKVRTVMRLERPDEEGQPSRRKLHITKSNSLMPAPLGITMGSEGNTYDLNPPRPPDDEPAKHGKKKAPRNEAACIWLTDFLGTFPRRVKDVIEAGKEDGHNVSTLYRALEAIKGAEFEMEGRKHWRLMTDDEIEE